MPVHILESVGNPRGGRQQPSVFSPVGAHDEQGPFQLNLGIAENRLVFDIRDDGAAPLGKIILALSPAAQHTAVDMTRTMACDVEFWNTFDPTIVEGTREQRLAAYREVRDFLARKIRERFVKR